MLYRTGPGNLFTREKDKNRNDRYVCLEMKFLQPTFGRETKDVDDGSAPY